MKNDGGSAFPIPDEGQGWGSAGMTLRDWFAGQALAGLCASKFIAEHAADGGAADGSKGLVAGIARRAFMLADAMLKDREASNGE